MDKLINDNKWRKKMYKLFYKYAQKYFNECKKLQKINPEKLTDEEIINIFKKITPIQERVRILGVMLNGLVLDGRNHLSNKFREELSKYIKDKDKFDKYWSILTQVSKLSFRQKKDLEIAKLAQSKTNREKQLKQIYEKYCWLDYMYYGPPASLKTYQKELQDNITNQRYLKIEIKEIKKTKKN